MTWAARISAVVLLGVAMLSGTLLGKRERAAEAVIEEQFNGAERYVDFGVRLVVVRKDPNGTPLHGDDAVRVSVVREHTRGAIYDTLTRSWAGQSTYPTVWYLSEEQEAIVLHSKKLPAGVWMQGSMGAGKTTAGGIWLALRVIEHATHPLKGAGVTAPTDKRMEELRKTLFGPKDRDGTRVGGMWPRSWYTWREGDQTCAVVTGLQIDFRSTHIQSAAAGSPIQGQNWAFVLNDELQDYYELDGDIQMRGRAAWGGRYQRFVTVTPKDDPGYRTFRDQIHLLTEDWIVQPVLGPNSPFIAEAHWERVKRGLSDREFARKVLAQDLPSENRLYYAFDREHNMRPEPRVGGRDVTVDELSLWGRSLKQQFYLLIGYDPGRTVDASCILRAWLPKGAAHMAPPDWFAIDECITRRQSTEFHILALSKLLREKYGLTPQQVLVRADPAGDTENDDERPDLTVYKQFQRAGFNIMAADYRAGKRHLVPREARIDMVNTLLHDATGRRRLFLACDDNRNCAVPTTLKAFEVQERDKAGRAERDEKGTDRDYSHFTANLGYCLWAIEKPRLDDLRSRRTA